ncbi:MAG TPA: hypothetical protein VFN03_12130, partial [Trueperaceae bacterium]|nr:hypothetical protein [Trueperaceae bacterium]
HERTELEVAAAATAAAGAEASGTEAAGAEPSGDGPDSRSPWPQSVRASLPPGVAVEHLTPVAELRIRRVAFLVVKEADPHSGRERFAELAFDEVTCVAPGSRNDPTAAAVFHEVEIEWLGEGDELDQAVLGALERLADAVGTVVNLTASAVSKLDRALALLAALEPD